MLIVQYKNDKWAFAQREFNKPRICFWAANREKLIPRKYQRLQYIISYHLFLSVCNSLLPWDRRMISMAILKSGLVTDTVLKCLVRSDGSIDIVEFSTKWRSMLDIVGASRVLSKVAKQAPPGLRAISSPRAAYVMWGRFPLSASRNVWRSSERTLRAPGTMWVRLLKHTHAPVKYKIKQQTLIMQKFVVDNRGERVPVRKSLNKSDL